MTDYLLDTHTLLWLSTDDDRLTDGVRDVVLDPENPLWVSAATVWELAIKKGLAKLSLSASLESFLEGQRLALGFGFVPVHTRDALRVEGLPLHHRDPFDRLLIAQALNRHLTLLSRDPNLASYDVDILWR